MADNYNCVSTLNIGRNDDFNQPTTYQYDLTAGDGSEAVVSLPRSTIPYHPNSRSIARIPTTRDEFVAVIGLFRNEFNIGPDHCLMPRTRCQDLLDSVNGPALNDTFAVYQFCGVKIQPLTAGMLFVLWSSAYGHSLSGMELDAAQTYPLDAIVMTPRAVDIARLNHRCAICNDMVTVDTSSQFSGGGTICNRCLVYETTCIQPELEEARQPELVPAVTASIRRLTVRIPPKV